MALFTDKQLMVGGAVVLVGGYLLWRKASPVLDAVNPTNDDNVFNQGFNWLYEKTWWADEGDTLGGDLADLLNPPQAAPGLVAPGKNTDTITGK